MDQDGTRQKRLTEDPASESHPRWTPEGDRIAFVSDKGGNKEIYVMNSDGKLQRNLTNNTSQDSSPGWSPDGTSIVFVSDRTDEGQDIYIMDSDGKNQERVTTKDMTEADPDYGAYVDKATLEMPPEVEQPGEQPETPILPINSSSPVLRNVASLPISAARVGQDLIISSTITNGDSGTGWSAISILQVRDEAGITRYVASQEQSIEPGGRAQLEFPWKPEEAGSYRVFVFVIDNSSSPQVLSTGASSNVTVSTSA
jgi:dipeptidyl aminopeptidase/acylaminoacyl peptidase